MSKPVDRLRPVHPGEVLREDFLAPLGLSVNALALALGVPSTRIHEIVKERRAVTADTALRLAQYFGGDAASWCSRCTAASCSWRSPCSLSCRSRSAGECGFLPLPAWEYG